MPSKNIFKWFPPYLAVWAGLFLFHNAWAALLGFHAIILLVLALFRPEIPPAILFKSKNIEWILFNILFCGLSGFGIYHLHAFVGLSANFKTELAALGLNSSDMPAFIIYFSLVNPFLEEYFWRAFLGNDTKGFYFGDLIYAGYHALIIFNKASLLVTLLSTASLAFIAWFWRQTKRENGGLLAPVLGHMAADLSILMSVYLIVR